MLHFRKSSSRRTKRRIQPKRTNFNKRSRRRNINRRSRSKRRKITIGGSNNWQDVNTGHATSAYSTGETFPGFVSALANPVTYGKY